MSGGSIDYAYCKIETIIEDMNREKLNVYQKAFVKHLHKIKDALHDIEWVLSSDYSKGDDKDAVMKVISNQDVVDTIKEDLIELENEFKKFKKEL